MRGRLLLVLAAFVLLAAAVMADRARAQNPPTYRGTQAAPFILVDPNGNPTAISPGSGGTVNTAPANGTGGSMAVVVGTSSTSAIGAAQSRVALAFRNEDRAATIAVCRNGVTPALNAAGCYTLPPQYSVSWTTGYVPLDAFNAVASAPNAQLTVEAH